MGNFKGKAEGLFMHCLVYKGSAGFPISTLVVVVVVGELCFPHCGHLVQEMGGATSNEWGEQSVSAHVNIPKRKLERKIMLCGLH